MRKEPEEKKGCSCNTTDIANLCFCGEQRRKRKICPFMSRPYNVDKDFPDGNVYCQKEECMAWEVLLNTGGMGIHSGYCKLIDKEVDNA